MLATFEELREQGTKRFGDVGAWAYDEWKYLNEVYFNGKNNVGPIVWGLTFQGESMGYYSVAENLIYLNNHLLRPIYPTHQLRWDVGHMNKRLASDVLLHEMIHQKIHQTGGWEGETSHNNVRFVEEVNRIAKLIGLNVNARVLKKETFRSKGKWKEQAGYMGMNELLFFPYGSRPSSYYRKRNDTRSLNWANR
jgi:hypothetical protein